MEAGHEQDRAARLVAAGRDRLRRAVGRRHVSMGGIGAASSRHGPQVDDVLALQVVTGEGELWSCSCGGMDGAPRSPGREACDYRAALIAASVAWRMAS